MLVTHPNIRLKTNQVKLNHITRHALNLFNGYPKSKSYRRFLSEHAYQENADITIFKKALSYMQQ